tara:strand:- start:164 stop:412 length:249 start_codon:yes stop_codon:yes gene_type:complete
MRITNKQISARIERDFGIPHINVFVDYDTGHSFFYSDDEATAQWLCLWEETTTGAYRLNSYTLDEWAHVFDIMRPKIEEKNE